MPLWGPHCQRGLCVYGGRASFVLAHPGSLSLSLSLGAILDSVQPGCIKPVNSAATKTPRPVRTTKIKVSLKPAVRSTRDRQ